MINANVGRAERNPNILRHAAYRSRLLAHISEMEENVPVERTYRLTDTETKDRILRLFTKTAARVSAIGTGNHQILVQQQAL